MKKKHIAALAGIAAVFAVGGSLAYFNQDLEAVNVLSPVILTQRLWRSSGRRMEKTGSRELR